MFVGNLVGVWVGVEDGVALGLGVKVDVAVGIGVSGVGVCVGRGVGVGASVDVAVGIGVGVAIKAAITWVVCPIALDKAIRAVISRTSFSWSIYCSVSLTIEPSISASSSVANLA